MKNILIILIVLGCVLPSSAQKSNNVPVIDIKTALANKKPMKLSEIATDIEYLSLKLPYELPKSLYGQEKNFIVRDQCIVYWFQNLERIFVYDGQGNFSHAFQDGDPLTKAIPGMTNNVTWDISPNEKHLVVSKWSSLNLFDINGNLIRTRPLPWKGCTFYFLDNDQIAVLRPRSGMEKDGHLVFIYNLNLEITDSLFWAKSAGPGSVQTRFGRSGLPSDGFYKLRDKVYFRPADQDTVFHILPNSKTKALFTIDLAEYRQPFKWTTNRKELEKYIQINSLFETKDFFITELEGPMRKDVNEYYYETLVFEKSTGQYFSTQRTTTNPDLDAYYEGIVGDIDGFGYHHVVQNDIQFSIRRPEIWKRWIESDTLKIAQIKDGKQIAKLQSQIEKTDKNSILLRIVHFDDPGKHGKKIRFKPKNPVYSDLSPVVPVRTNHQWIGAEGLSDITYDPTDDSFWLVKMSFRGADTIEHRSRNGEILPGSFILDEQSKPINIEGITVSSADSTLWLSDGLNKFIWHFDKTGKKLDDGFPSGGSGIYGIAWDPKDNTLWILEPNNYKLLHYTVTGEKLHDEIDLISAGCEEARGVAYDPRDNSFWIVNASPHKMIHISKTGELLPGNFYYDPTLGLPDGVALDYKGFEFWIGDWGRK